MGIISDILDGTQRARKRINETSAAKRVKDLGEDAREFWETSQNPLVYQASSIVDAVTAETDTAAAKSCAPSSSTRLSGATRSSSSPGCRKACSLDCPTRSD